MHFNLMGFAYNNTYQTMIEIVPDQAILLNPTIQAFVEARTLKSK